MIIDLTGKEHELNGCLGCEIANGNLKTFCGILYESNDFLVMQDYELPINGFIVISSKKHVEKLTELDENAQINLMKIISKLLSVLRANNIAEEYNLILEEKKGYHFHVWLMPRHDWMIQKFGKVLKNIKNIQEYALQNLRDEASIKEIEKTCMIVKNEMREFKL